MIELIKKNKIILVGVVCIAVAFAWYGMRTPSADPALVVTDVSTASSEEERAVLDTLLQLRTIQLSGAIFTDPVFNSLQDFRTEIVAEPVGRRNPFAPMGGNSASTSTPRGGAVSAPAGSLLRVQQR